MSIGIGIGIGIEICSKAINTAYDYFKSKGIATVILTEKIEMTQ